MAAVSNTVAPPMYPRKNQQLVATALLGGGLSLTAVALLGNYLAERSKIIGAGKWELTVPLTQPNVMIANMVLTVIAAQWVAWSVARSDKAPGYRMQAYWGLGIITLLSVAFINQSWYLVRTIGLKVADGGIAPAFYGVVGAQMAMVVLALVYTLVIGFRVLAGQYGSRNSGGVAGLALFWYLTAGVYALVWYAVYVTK